MSEPRHTLMMTTQKWGRCLLHLTAPAIVVAYPTLWKYWDERGMWASGRCGWLPFVMMIIEHMFPEV